MILGSGIAFLIVVYAYWYFAVNNWEDYTPEDGFESEDNKEEEDLFI